MQTQCGMIRTIETFTFLDKLEKKFVKRVGKKLNLEQLVGTEDERNKDRTFIKTIFIQS